MRILKEQRGSTIAVLTVSMFVMAACAGMAIDIGAIASFKSQLQAAVDAAALAGARGYITDEGQAATDAIAVAAQNKYQNRSLQLDAGEISFPGNNSVHVSATRTVSLYFLRVAGINTARIHAEAIAAFGELRNTKGLKPWAVPEEHWNVGDVVTLKLGSITEPDNNNNIPASWHFPVCFPPINRGTPSTGADEYRDNILNGTNHTIEVGDVLQVEPGNMVGPTIQGVNDILGQDPNAYWAGDNVANSRYPGSSSPRICKIAVIDPNSLPGDGRTTVTVERFAVFFLEGMQGQNLIGRFMEIATTGELANPNGGAGSDLYGVKLTG